MVVPEGYVPIFAFSFCPPSGIFVQLGMYLLDVVNDVVQIGTFLYHRDWWFAGFMSLFVFVNLAGTIHEMSKLSKLKRFDLLGEARLCVTRGVLTDAWQMMLACERNIEAPGTGVMGPYGATLLQLTPLQAASCLFGLCTSAKAMAEGRLQVEVSTGADAGANALKAVRPVKAVLLSAWYWGAFAAELAAFAVASAVLHPIITVPGYLLGGMANGAAAWWAGSQDFLQVAVTTFFTVGFAMVGHQTKSFLRSRASIAKGPGFIPAASILLRFIAWAALCFLDLPNGLLPLGSLGRPMGLPVLREKFLEPATASREALACFTSQFGISFQPEANATSMSLTEEVSFGACSWPAAGELSTPSTIFNTCLLLLAMVLVPIHICVVVGMLLLNPIYACAADNLPLKEEVEAKQREINAFATQNEQTAGQHELLSSLPD
ncbi:unnamed protein product [Symbiodinium sp. CCMP2456]|nr:unnamed protein product [Symbiodinium sp. CCMP2456]